MFRKFRDNLLKPTDKVSIELKKECLEKYKKERVFKDEESHAYIHISDIRKLWTDPEGPYEDNINLDFWGARY